MKATDMAAYFAKKIAKPIPYGYVDDAEGIRTNYLVEPVAMSEGGVVHLTVTAKNMESTVYPGMRHGSSPVFLGEVSIPLLDGDSTVSVIEMAVAWVGLRDECLGLDEGHRMKKAHADMKYRHDELMEQRPSGPRV